MKYEIKTVNNLEECKKIWYQMVDIKTLYDHWEIRTAFYNPKYVPEFYLAYEGSELVGLLPLQNNTDKGYLEFYGGDFMENNRIYATRDVEEMSRNFLENIDKKVKLSSLLGENTYIQSLTFHDSTYDLDLTKFNSLEDFIDNHFNARKRKAFRRILREFEEIPHTIEYDRWDDLELMMFLNMERFDEDSAFNDKARRDAFRNLVDADLKVRMMSIMVDNKPQNVNVFIEFRGTFYAVMSGTNIELEYDLRKYALLRKFEYAIENKFKIFDAGRNDCNWKEFWHLTPHPLYIYKNYEN